MSSEPGTMQPRVTIVMYHYVRPLQRTRFPAIKGLDLALFRGQLHFLQQHYTLIGMDELLAAIEAETPLPPRAALLTFDDGYSDHYQYVFPILDQERLQGAFYPPCATISRRQLLDVNKIHFVLASVTNNCVIEDQIDQILINEQGFDDESLDKLKRQYRIADHLDSAERVYIKNLLQFALPEAVRNRITDQLFATFVSADQTAFAEELYITEDQARTMVSCGMHIGGHGDHHYWLSHVPETRIAAEIKQTSDMLMRIGMPTERRTFCYPYGDYNDVAVRLLAGNGYRAAFTTKAAIANIASDHHLMLPRLDTLDLPGSREAPVSRRTLA